ncbi:Dabb family protein [Frondihabitans sucicola]|nr:Dabb family protein [Frondihabitans sucicola]
MSDLASELARVGVARFTAPEYAPGNVVHVVLFRFRPEVDQRAKDEVEHRFRRLQSEPDAERGAYILSIEAGTQASGEGAGGGFELGFVVRFASEGDRNYYVGAPVQTDPALFDPAHAAFKEFVGPLIANVLVYDIVD